MIRIKKKLEIRQKKGCLLVMRQDKMLLPWVGESCVASISTSANSARRGHLAALLEKDKIVLKRNLSTT